jgi:hypothetical protein
MKCSIHRTKAIKKKNNNSNFVSPRSMNVAFLMIDLAIKKN